MENATGKSEELPVCTLGPADAAAGYCCQMCGHARFVSWALVPLQGAAAKRLTVWNLGAGAAAAQTLS